MASVLAVVACRQLVGIGDQPPGAGSADAGNAETGSEAAPACGGFAWAGGACGSCMENACCAEATACRGDVTCGPTFDCQATCAGDDDPCRSHCVTQPDTAMAALGSCQATSCSSECGLVCGGFFGLNRVAPGAAAKACTACYVAQSCPFATTCAQNESCLANEFCNEVCNPFDLICQGNCGYSIPVTLGADAGAGFGPANSACATTCQNGTNWSCVGSAVWPVATTSPITFQVEVYDAASHALLPGVTVRACDGSDADCLTPEATGTTDSNGLVTLTSQSVPFTGYLQAASSGYVTQLSYVYPPITESTDPGVVVGVGLYPSSYIAEVGAANKVTLDPSLGIIAAFPHDCSGVPAPGVSFSGTSLGSRAQAYYEVTNAPTIQATATSLPTPEGGFINVAPGLVTLVASANGTPVATVAVQVQKNAITVLPNLVPTP